ncbi:MAG: DnaJ domain-containing protein [Proteobacteria bacterium]|nr:DnaJ domain-containing protein [Pseudomonadota bacterium]
MLEYFAELGVKLGTPWEEVQKTYKEKIKMCHPDVSSSRLLSYEEAHRRSQKLNEAYSKLSTFYKRVEARYSDVKAFKFEEHE